MHIILAKFIKIVLTVLSPILGKSIKGCSM